GMAMRARGIVAAWAMIAAGLAVAATVTVTPTAAAADEPIGGLPECYSAPFSDIAVSSQFCSEIEWMNERSISTGYADDTFRPGANVSRQAMAAFMVRLEWADLEPCSQAP